MGWFAIVKKFTNIAMFVWKFGIQNLVWTEPSRADSQIDSPPQSRNSILSIQYSQLFVLPVRRRLKRRAFPSWRRRSRSRGWWPWLTHRQGHPLRLPSSKGFSRRWSGWCGRRRWTWQGRFCFHFAVFWTLFFQIQFFQDRNRWINHLRHPVTLPSLTFFSHTNFKRETVLVL